GQTDRSPERAGWLRRVAELVQEPIELGDEALAIRLPKPAVAQGALRRGGLERQLHDPVLAEQLLVGRPGGDQADAVAEMVVVEAQPPGRVGADQLGVALCHVCELAPREAPDLERRARVGAVGELALETAVSRDEPPAGTEPLDGRARREEVVLAVAI